MIHAQCRGDKREYSDKLYKTIVIDDVKKMPRRKKGALGACFLSDKKIYVEKKIILVPFFR